MRDYFVLISYIEMGIVWIAIPAFAVYPVVCRLIKKEWRSLCSWVDIVSYFSMHLIWFYGFTHDFNHRGAGRILDLVILGCLYGGSVLLRIPFVWRHPEWRMRIAAISLFILVCVSIALTWLINLASVE